jgi:hypothetical protein
MSLSRTDLVPDLVSTSLTLDLFAWDFEQRTQFCFGEAEHGTDSLTLELELGGDSLLTEAASPHAKRRGVVRG